MVDAPLIQTKSDGPHPKVVATIKGVEVLEAPHLKPAILRRIRNGDYERPEVEFGLANLRPGDRILEMGAGAGIVGSVFAKNIRDIELRSFEANPDLIEHIRMIYAHNQLDAVALVTNRIVVTGQDQPDHMDFHVRTNFLGSRLSGENNEPEARRIRVATSHYDDITQDFPHNVLIMDIEGGELDFLTGADLSDVELVMLELHPNVYGAEGREQIFTLMQAKGFELDRTTSKGQVASFKRPERLKLKPDYSQISSGPTQQQSYDLDPQKALADGIITKKNAVLAKTPRSQGHQIAASVFDQHRNQVPEAICWLTHQKPATTLRSHPRRNRIRTLEGTWLFGGCFNPAFGHFLTETIARLWALDHISQPLDGVLFLPNYNDHENNAAEMFSNLSKVLDVDIKFKICDAFYRVDKLVIPPQGNGLGRLMLSCPEMRAFMKKHIRRDFEPTPHKKLYISRSGQFNKVGRIFLGEHTLETHLRDEGYTIFHPQDHSWEDQLRHYLSATHILGPDGSPFHLVNYTGRSDLSVGIIQRRPAHEANQMAQQGRLYGVSNAVVVSHLGRLWARSGDRRAAQAMVSEVQLAPLCEDLKSRGFISRKADWLNLSDAELKASLQSIADASNADYRRVSHINESLTDFPMLANPDRPTVFM
ncbi:hypothetical protein GCM10016455_19540 [Aliiroseovarius zhejiangensis]|uniref:FkbM family methyltransferase n=1 Tax=Aliiroseovarius zhejiangensis TaxID=1632025 RepID=A0ABQ3IZ61_9RHOB|nr:FkbM family methyltransferase [Aliiroseovarius zhejiangensis]GHE98855.1 hypothetical protein GCM10016455_19540 [Aliiroseovarius zhejiangensis]